MCTYCNTWHTCVSLVCWSCDVCRWIELPLDTAVCLRQWHTVLHGGENFRPKLHIGVNGFEQTHEKECFVPGLYLSCKCIRNVQMLPSFLVHLFYRSWAYCYTEKRNIFYHHTYRAFQVAGPRLWNSLPASLHQSDMTVGQFKKLLKTHLFSWDCGALVTVAFTAPCINISTTTTTTVI